MKVRRIGGLILVLTTLFVFALAVQAQELTETFQSRVGVSFSHPAGWVIDDQDDFVFVGNTQSAVNAAMFNSDPQPGDIVFMFVTPAAYSDLGASVTDASSPEDVVIAILQVGQWRGSVDAFTGLNVPAARALTTDSATGMNLMVVAMQTDGGTFTALVGTTDPIEQNEALLIRLLNTVTYSPAAAPAPVVSDSDGEGGFVWINARVGGINEATEFGNLGNPAYHDGNLYVVDNTAGVWVLDPATGEIRSRINAPALNFNLPSGIAVDPATGDIYVASWGANTVFVISASGQLMRTIGAPGIEDGQFGSFSPQNIAVHDGLLYAGDGNDDADGNDISRIQVFDLQGNFRMAIDTTELSFLEPTFAIGPDGAIYATGFGSGITILNPDGSVRTSNFARSATFAEPISGLAVGDDGTVYAVSWNSGIMIISPDGNLVATHGEDTESTLPDGFMPALGQIGTPEGLVVVGDMIYMTDNFNGSVRAISAFSLSGGAPVPTTSSDSLSYGDTVTGEISDTTPEQNFRFSGSAGDVVTITMLADNPDTLDTRLYLYDAAGVEVAENDDSRDDSVGYYNARILNFSLPAAGEYRILATRFNGTGTYRLTLEGGSGPTSSGSSIENQTLRGTISDPSGEELWRFTGNAGEMVTITMIADDSNALDTRLYLYTENGYAAGTSNYIAENDDSRDESIGYYNSRIQNFTLPETGRYVIRATRFSSGTGEYTLTIEGAGGGSSSGGDAVRQWASSATGTSQFGTSNWSFAQATGAPDTADCGDRVTAWASASSRGSDMLALEFDQAVIPTQVNIHQTYNPGSIIRVELTNTSTSTVIEVPNSADPPGNTPCPGVFTLNITGVSTPVNGVIIYLDQTIGGNWNEIDAVELVGTP